MRSEVRSRGRAIWLDFTAEFWPNSETLCPFNGKGNSVARFYDVGGQTVASLVVTFCKYMGLSHMHFAPRPPGRFAAFCLTVLAAASVHGQIISNGSFENDYTGWTASGHQGIAQNDPNRPATAGFKVVVFNNNDQFTNAVLSQTFPTTSGQRYELSFDYGCVGPISDQRLQVILEGNGVLLDKTIEIAAPVTQPFYVPQHITFVANSTNTKVTFLDAGYTYVFIDSLLDNVQVVAVNANAPLINSDPQRTFAVQGGSAVFNVSASNATSYQWQFDGVNIPNATSSSYTVTNADSNKAGNYSVIVTNANGSVNSSAATLTVIPNGILLNGSFEYGSAAWTYVGGIGTSTSTNTGYGVTDGVVLTHFNWGQIAPGGSIYQVINTIPGETYVVNFDLGAFSFVNSNEQRCRVTVTDGSNNSLSTQDYSVSAAGNGGRYEAKQLTFVANGPTARLTFLDISQSTINIDLLLDNIRVNLQNAPLIVSHPQNAAVLVGDPVTFTVSAAGQAPLHYQWRFNDGNTWQNVGPDSATFNIPQAQASNAGMYDVTVSNNFGSVTSNAAVLTVVTPGSFSNGSFEGNYAGWTATGNQAVVSGAPFTTTDGTKAVAFNVGQQPANGTLAQSFTTTAGHTYQLTFDAGAISASNQNEMRIQVTVQGQGQPNPAFTRSVSVFAPGNGTRWLAQTFLFVADSANTTLTFQDTSPTTQNVDLMLDNVRITEQPPPGAFTNGSFESGYSGWVVSGNQNVASGAPYVATDGTKAVAFNGGQQTPNGTLSQSFATNANQAYTLMFDLGAISFVNQSAQQIQVTATGSNSTLLNQTVSVSAPGNGTQYSTKTLSFVAASATTTLTFQDTSATSQNVDLMLDNVRVISQNGPAITAQPQNATAPAGGSANFSVTATGQGTVSYQWRFNNGGNWNNIPGANGSTFTINNVQNSDQGTYDVIVSDTSGEPPLTSSPASLTVVPAGVPANGSFEFDYAGWTATGSQAVVSGSPFTATSGVKAVAFNIGQQTPNGVLSQTISTTQGQVYSLNFDVGAISFSNQNEQRLRVAVTGAGNATLLAPQQISVFAPGNGTTYIPKSYVFTANGSSATLVFTDISPTSQNLDLVLDNVRVTSQSGPVISADPQNATAPVGTSAMFSVQASGTAPVGYQWRFNNGGGWSDISGANSATYSIPSVQNSDAGMYAVVVSDASGQPPVTSASATLTVVPAGVPANGSFEFDYSGWTAAGNQAVVTGAPFNFTNGSKAVAFNVGQQTPNGTLSQAISTTSNTVYTLTFDVGAISFSNQNAQRLQVTVLDGSSNALLPAQVVTVNAPGNGTTYLPQTFSFTANGSTATLMFQDVSATSQNIDLMLDNVRVTSQSAANPFTNGSFESDYSAWTFSGSQAVVTGSPFVATNGSKAVAFNVGQQAPNGVLSQGFATSPNQAYTLTFDVGAISFSNQSQQSIQVNVVGANNATLLATQTITVTAPGNGTTYAPQTFNFTANGTAATVTFLDASQTSQNVDLMLDNVAISATGP